jgi:hypothetical protein
VTVSADVHEQRPSGQGDEVVQLYLRDDVASVTRPVKELKGFKKVSCCNPGETTTVSIHRDIRTSCAFYGLEHEEGGLNREAFTVYRRREFGRLSRRRSFNVESEFLCRKNERTRLRCIFAKR